MGYEKPTTLMNHANNKHWETAKVGRQNGLSDMKVTSLKYEADYMASINHPFSFAVMKAFAWAIAKKVIARHGCFISIFQKLTD